MPVAATSPRDEVVALGRAAGDAADRLATTPAQSLHAAIADRVFRSLGPAALPARLLHDGISSAVYAGVRAGISAASMAAATVARGHARDPYAVSRSASGAQVVAAINALVGHELERDGDPLAIEMELWHKGEPLPPTPAAFAQALPDATADVAVFVHGLGETERSWRLGRRPAYGQRLHHDAGWTALHVRYNSGLSVAENGRRLSALLDEATAAWPVQTVRIALIGHSMGGLVARAAGQEAAARDARWRARLTHIACLGTPHRGAPLEQAVHGLSRILELVPEAHAFGGILEQRSPGIRDLRRGVDAGPLLQDVRHLFVGATLTADPDHPLAAVLGDLLVRSVSAGGPVDCEVAEDDVVCLAGLTHFDLLNHPAVYERLRAFLG